MHTKNIIWSVPKKHDLIPPPNDLFVPKKPPKYGWKQRWILWLMWFKKLVSSYKWYYLKWQTKVLLWQQLYLNSFQCQKHQQQLCFLNPKTFHQQQVSLFGKKVAFWYLIYAYILRHKSKYEAVLVAYWIKKKLSKKTYEQVLAACQTLSASVEAQIKQLQNQQKQITPFWYWYWQQKKLTYLLIVQKYCNPAKVQKHKLALCLQNPNTWWGKQVSLFGKKVAFWYLIYAYILRHKSKYEAVLVAYWIKKQAKNQPVNFQQLPALLQRLQQQTQTLSTWLKNKLFNFEQFSQNAKEVLVFNQPTKIAAEIKNLYLTFTNPVDYRQKNLVLRGPSLQIYEGYAHALIGESGSGKSVLSSLFYGLTGTNATIDSGEVLLYNNPIQNFSQKQWEKAHLRGRIVSAVFQNPMSILNPTMKVGKQISEGLLHNKICFSKAQAKNTALYYLKMTKINNPKAVWHMYPHELSGGMIQRIAISAIVSLKPKILILDEPTTALDPTVQALVLDIIRELQQKLKITIIFITHDLGVVASIADFISIMYAGQIIEYGTKDEILNHPQHPYTWGLITSMPDFNHGKKLQTIRGSVPSNLNNIQGDAFAIRNDYALGQDLEYEPAFYQISPTHFVKSALLDAKAPSYQPPLIIQKKWQKYRQHAYYV